MLACRIDCLIHDAYQFVCENKFSTGGLSVLVDNVPVKKVGGEIYFYGDWLKRFVKLSCFYSPLVFDVLISNRNVMARETRIDVCALNIAMHAPHSVDKYVELMLSAYRSRRVVSSRGVNGALIGALYYVDKSNPAKGLTGEIYRFIQLDPNEPWFNVQNKEAANEEELKEIKIPDHLKPHLARFSFVFFPKGHRLYVETKNAGKTIGPSTVAAIFERIFLDPSLERFGEIEVTVEPDKNEVAEIFNIPFIHHLKIELLRPNPDDHDGDERKFLKRLEKQGAKKMQVALISTRNDILSPDEDTKRLAQVAASNGYVSASGRDLNDQPIERSTKNAPWIESFPYNSDIQTSNDVLLDAAHKMHRQLT